MESTKKGRLLIISNIVLSTTNSNGKTILSYFDSLYFDSVRQLYFSEENPEILEYEYYKLSDKDVIKSKFTLASRGKAIKKHQGNNNSCIQSKRKVKKYGDLVRLLREIIWIGNWKSKELITWLDEFDPTTIFFVGGDSCFAYRICIYIKKRYNARLSLYITDDYVMPRIYDSIIGKLRRRIIRNYFLKCLKNADVFFTISEPMRRAYEKEFGRKSFLAVNMVDSLKDNSIKRNQDKITLIYAGSLYYGRDIVLNKLSLAIEKYKRQNNQRKIELKVFTNNFLDNNEKKKISGGKSTKFYESIKKEELKVQLNRADILVFVESFERKQIEKTKYSLSTKVPEYLSLHKPILAIGPMEIGSIQYLKDVSQCVSDESQIFEKLRELLDSEYLQSKISDLAEKKYCRYNMKQTVQERFLKEVFGILD